MTWQHMLLVQIYHFKSFVHGSHVLLVQEAVPPPSHPDDHASHGEWYEKIWKKGEMHEIEKLHKEKAGIKTKTTVKKRRDSAPAALAKKTPKKVLPEKVQARYVNCQRPNGQTHTYKIY